MWTEAIKGAAPSEDMPLNDGDIKRIDARIAAGTALLQDKIAAEVARLKPRGWRKALHLLREWSVLGVTATIIVALLALALTQWNAANGRVAAEASFRTHTEDRLTAIEASLLTLRASQSPKKVLQEIGNLPAKEFALSLPALRAVSEQSALIVKPDLPTLKIVVAKLSFVNESAPGYWQTVMRFLQFASAGMSPDIPPPGTTPSITFSHVILDGSPALPGRPCVLKLEDVDLSGKFENCRIIFTDQPVRMHNVVFVNCAFEFPNIDDPPPFLKRATLTILAAGVQNVSIPAL